ncbi:hypothetical protein AB6A40_002795 [Gnathostoma spinigerum]|uniref:MADF domain-containing protein n=1 Tax=Gnathostoma spinigerum TaxID=75299 RepID=A0ABD6E8Y9_9BILA
METSVSPANRTGNEPNKGGRMRMGSGVLMNDELRFSIIDAVYLRPSIWSTVRDQPRNLMQRKEDFIEIANLLSTDDSKLTCYDIEKQWKNLKDTYFKVRKRLVYDEAGCMVPPRWKFFSAMMFLDQSGSAENGANDGHSNTNHDASISNNADRNHANHNTSISNNINTETASILGKRSGNGCIVAKKLSEGMKQSSAPPPPQLKDVDSEANLRSFSVDDEYSAFCMSLVWPLREIGGVSRVELLRLQKVIRDSIHETQMSLLLRRNNAA